MDNITLKLQESIVKPTLQKKKKKGFKKEEKV